ncbi:hypothetical protein SASPL_143901 [Salvia splendens]|uniref:Reverse transcriptase Ty1/copia-type domain-containing protein n=1 Tax=Salvia splendens TaxID=180675 RepID=A0A8X8WN16_SALSN|nr:hypothetical protein SASPL_143901 [Salvia splendens]
MQMTEISQLIFFSLTMLHQVIENLHQYETIEAGTQRSDRQRIPPAHLADYEVEVNLSSVDYVFLMGYSCDDEPKSYDDAKGYAKWVATVKGEILGLRFISKEFPDYVCRLKKSLYCLKQASRAWYGKIAQYLEFCCYNSSETDFSLFIKKSSSSCMMVLLYVNDMIITGNDDVEITYLLEALSVRFDMKSLVEVSCFLGLELTKSNGYFVSQQGYASNLLDHFRMESYLKFAKDEGNKKQSPVALLSCEAEYVAASMVVQEHLDEVDAEIQTRDAQVDVYNEEEVQPHVLGDYHNEMEETQHSNRITIVQVTIVQVTNEWTIFMDNLVEAMFLHYQDRRRL